MTSTVIDTSATPLSEITPEFTEFEFGTRAALIPSMILTFIFVAISLAADAFMLTFLNATVKELRPTGTRVVEIRSNAGIDRAA